MTNATKLLWEDHRKAEDLYHQFQEAGDPVKKGELAETLCRELECHCRLEEYLFYPAVARELPDPALVRRFTQEHARVKRHISEIRLSREDTGGSSMANQVLLSRLMACLQEHVAEEEDLAFPFLKADQARDEELGSALARHKLKLKVIPPLCQTLVVQAPVRMVYNQWTQFESFPLFLKDVKSVRQLDPAHVAWDVVIGGREQRWTAEIYEQIPDERIAWRSVDGAVNAGSVSFRPLATDATRMLVELAYEPQGLLEDVGALLGVMDGRLATALDRFKQFVESSPRESGAWRGRIAGDPME